MQRVAALEPGDASGGVDAGQRALHQPDVVALGELAQVERRRRAEAERRRHRGGPVDQGVVGGQQIDLEAAAREGAQRQNRLDGGDAGAGDDDAGHAGSVRRARPPANRQNHGDLCG